MLLRDASELGRSSRKNVHGSLQSKWDATRAPATKPTRSARGAIAKCRSVTFCAAYLPSAARRGASRLLEFEVLVVFAEA